VIICEDHQILKLFIITEEKICKSLMRLLNMKSKSYIYQSITKLIWFSMEDKHYTYLCITQV